MTLFYGITFAVSLLMLGVCFRVDRKRDPWLLLLFLFVAVCNAGYLALSLSRTLTAALIAIPWPIWAMSFCPFSYCGWSFTCPICSVPGGCPAV